jgi:hypothetical protein|tara:strand:+ start:11572 stop:11955 length:384 start_codon:yes stop_codon:yes gene_type:complete
MAWTKTTENSLLVGKEESVTLPSSATTEYSSIIDFIGPNAQYEKKYVGFGFNPTSVSGTDLDIALYGSMTRTGTKYLLKDAVVTDITATGLVFGQVDLNAYPAPYYWLAWTADTDESNGSISAYVVF